MFQKAERKKAKLRLGLCGTSGSGKTYSSLLIAKGIGKKIAVVDTENHSAELYAGMPNMPEYDVLTLSPPYETEKYVSAISEAEKQGYDVIILDSISHAWAGEGGLLDQQGKIADSGKGNSYTAWRNVTPKHNKFIEKMLSCNIHLIATMRSKTEYALVTNDKGKQEPKKMGMAPIQRDGMDYEFTVVLDIDQSHNAIPSKDRTSLFDGKIFTPSEDTGVKLLAWLDSGKDVVAPKKDDVPDFEETNADSKTSNKLADDEVLAVITDITPKKFNDKTAYFIKTATGGEYGTLNADLADKATSFKKEKTLVKLRWKPGSKPDSKEVIDIAV